MGDISPNFSLYEVACKCGCGLDNIDMRLMPILEAVRHFEGGHSLTPNSACRCVEHNETVQKQAKKNYVPYSSKSVHMPDEDGLCKAVDIPSDNPKALYDFLNGLFPNIYGIGLYSWGVHIDTRNYKARW